MKRGTGFWKGAVIGATMTVPGASGGTMAMLLGIYEELLGAAAELFHDTKKQLGILLPVLLGGLCGAGLMARQVEKLLLFHPAEAGGFFAGLVTGGVPLLLWQAGKEKKPLWQALWLFPGAAAGIFLPLCPAFFGAEQELPWLLLPLVGVVLAAALVLPGVSASACLYLFGIYDETLAALREGRWGFLVPLAVGAACGVFFTAKLFKRLLEKYPAPCRYVIAGFLLAASCDTVRVLPSGGELWRMALAGAAGVTIMLAFSAGEWRKEKNHDQHTRVPRRGRRRAGKSTLRGVAGDLPRADQ